MNYFFQEASVYSSTYHKFNCNINGEWVELDDFDSFDEFMEHIKELHKDEDDPEFFFEDSTDMHINGSPSIEDIMTWYEKFKFETYDIDEYLVEAMIDEGLCDWTNFNEYYKEHYEGCYDSYEDYGTQLALDEGLPEHLLTYLNADDYGEEMASDFHVVEFEHKIYLFNHN